MTIRDANPSAQLAAAPGAQSAAPAAASPQAPPAIIPWPQVLCDPRFAHERETVEAPFRRSLIGQGSPAGEDFQAIVDSVEKMRGILRQMTAEISVREGLGAERFLDQLASEAREEANVKLTSATTAPSEPSAVVPATGQTESQTKP
jgi:hypothetical protein